jgi:hypothetical protein
MTTWASLRHPPEESRPTTDSTRRTLVSSRPGLGTGTEGATGSALAADAEGTERIDMFAGIPADRSGGHTFDVSAGLPTGCPLRC